MTKSNDESWIYAGFCPICQTGMRRVRACEGPATGTGQPLHGYVLCDDCETIWLAPELDSQRLFADIERPACPVCHASLFGPQSRWATVDDLRQLDWMGKCMVDHGHESLETTRLLELDDFVADLDSVAQPDLTGENAIIANALEAAERLADANTQFDPGLDDEGAEPKPGC